MPIVDNTLPGLQLTEIVQHPASYLRDGQRLQEPSAPLEKI